MYIITLTYKTKTPIEEIDKYLQAHRDFLEKQYSNGNLLASGPKIPRDGGIIITTGKINRKDLDTILELDPFYVHNLVDYQVTEFTPVKNHSAIRDLL